MIEQIGDACVILVQLKDQIIFEQVHAVRARQRHSHVEMLARGIGVDDRHPKDLLEVTFQLGGQGFATVSDHRRLDAKPLVFLGRRQQLEHGSISAKHVRPELIQRGDNLRHRQVHVIGPHVIAQTVGAVVSGQHQAGTGEMSARGGNERDALPETQRQHPHNLARSLDPGVVGEDKIAHGARRPGRVEHVEFALEQLLGIGRSRQELCDAVARDARIGDDAIEVFDHVVFREDGKVGGAARGRVDMVLSKNRLIVRRSSADQLDQLTKLSSLCGFQAARVSRSLCARCQSARSQAHISRGDSRCMVEPHVP